MELQQEHPIFTHVAHLLEFPHLGGRFVDRSFVLHSSSCSGAEENGSEMIVGSMGIPVQRMAHKTKRGSSEGRSLRTTKRADQRENDSGKGNRTHRVHCEGITRLVAKVDSPLLGRRGLSEVVPVKHDIGPLVAVEVVHSAL